jgi:hypothetical protein
LQHISEAPRASIRGIPPRRASLAKASVKTERECLDSGLLEMVGKGSLLEHPLGKAFFELPMLRKRRLS